MVSPNNSMLKYTHLPSSLVGLTVYRSMVMSLPPGGRALRCHQVISLGHLLPVIFCSSYTSQERDAARGQRN